MNEDFYKIPSVQEPKVNQPANNSFQVSTAQTNTVPFFDFSDFLSMANTFLLAWTIFYSIVLVSDFFFYRIKFSSDEVSREKQGVKSLNGAFRLWVSYAVYLLIFMVYLNIKNEWYGFILGLLGLIFAFSKVFILDLTHLPVVGKYASNVIDAIAAPFKLLGDAIGNILAPTPPPTDKKK